MSIIVKNIHIFKDGAWRPIKKVFKDNSWRTMRGIFYQGDWYEIGETCVVMPDGCAVDTTVHPRWNENSTHYGTDNFGFKALPVGFVNLYGSFLQLGGGAYFQTTTELTSTNGRSIIFTFDSNNIILGGLNSKEDGFYVRGVKDYTGELPTGDIIENAYTDGSNNNYNAVVLGNKLWTVNNLHSTKYQNGTNINLAETISEWGSTSGQCCWYEYDSDTYGEYGLMYNWYAGTNQLISGDGWRVPSESDWIDIYTELDEIDWCGSIEITTNNIGIYLKSCRQVNHPLA